MWLFSIVHFQMLHQMMCIWRCIVTLVAFVWFFSTMRFDMSPQIAWIGIYIVALVAFVWIYNVVSFFLYDFHICILQVIFVKTLFHCTVCCAPNWINFFYFWSPKITIVQLFFYGILSLFSFCRSSLVGFQYKLFQTSDSRIDLPNPPTWPTYHLTYWPTRSTYLTFQPILPTWPSHMTWLEQTCDMFALLKSL